MQPAQVRGLLDFCESQGLFALSNESIERAIDQELTPIRTELPDGGFTVATRSRVVGVDSSHTRIAAQNPSQQVDISRYVLDLEIVLLAHQHLFYERGTPEDGERRVFHEGVISKDLAGQREFSWGEVVCRLETTRNKDWLVVAYSRDAKVPLHERETLLRLLAHEKLPDERG